QGSHPWCPRRAGSALDSTQFPKSRHRNALPRAGILFHTSHSSTLGHNRACDPETKGRHAVIGLVSKRVAAAAMLVSGAALLLATDAPARAAEQWNFYMHQSA